MFVIYDTIGFSANTFTAVCLLFSKQTKRYNYLSEEQHWHLKTDHSLLSTYEYTGLDGRQLALYDKGQSRTVDIKLHEEIFEPVHEKTNNLHMRKQRRRPASR